jgi:lauroyl/myristoyl acyltransferase
MANLTLVGLCQRAPGFSSLTERVRPIWYFRITRWAVLLSGWFGLHTRKRAKVFREALRGSFHGKELSARTNRYLYHLRLFKDIHVAWVHWGDRYNEWITIEGEGYLEHALREGKGAVLLSPHNYGLSKIVAPVLTAHGYRIHRGGNGGKKGLQREARWGNNGAIGWRYLDYKGGYWHRLQLLKSIQHVLTANEIVHISPRGYLEGEEEMAIQFFGTKYYLDANWFRLIRVCQAPAVLPCFALATGKGKIHIIIHPPLESSGRSIAEEFAKINSDYITKFPECGRLWKSVYVKRGKW